MAKTTAEQVGDSFRTSDKDTVKQYLDRSRWDRSMIADALGLLDRAAAELRALALTANRAERSLLRRRLATPS